MPHSQGRGGCGAAENWREIRHPEPPHSMNSKDEDLRADESLKYALSQKH